MLTAAATAATTTTTTTVLSTSLLLLLLAYIYKALFLTRARSILQLLTTSMILKAQVPRTH